MNASAGSSEPAQKLLLALLEQAFSEGWRASDDFLRHFPPTLLVESLVNEEDVRVKLLTATTGVHEKLARRKSVASAADDLTLALEEQTTTPNEVLGLYPFEVQVRCLPAAQLWQFLTEVPFWENNQKGDRNRAVERMAFTLEAALANAVLTLRDLFDGVGFDEVARSLPKNELEQIVVRALEGGRSRAALTEDVLLDVVPLRALVSALNLQTLWERIVLPRVAGPSGYLEGGAVAAPAPRAFPPQGSSSAEPAPRAKVETLPGEDLFEIEAAQDEGPLLAVRERLQTMDRLPRDTGLPLAVLASIESMYEDLKQASSDDERVELMKDAFPNETYLRIGMLALIDLLDPSIDVQDPTIRAADIDALLKIVLFEERKRRSSTRPSVPPPPPGSDARRSRSLAPPPRSKKGGSGQNAGARDSDDIDVS